MRRRLAIAFLASVVGLVAAAVAFVRTQAAGDLTCGYLMREGSRRVGGTVTIGRCDIHPLRVEFVLHRVKVVVPAEGVTATARRVDARLRELQGIGGKLTLDRLEVSQPVIEVRPPPPPAGPRPPLSRPPCEAPRLPFRLLAGAVRGATVDVVLPDGRAVHARDLTLLTTGDGPVQRLRLTAGRLAIHDDGDRVATSVEARLQVDPTVPEVRVDALSAESGDLRVGLKGTARDLCHPRLEATVAATGSLARLFETLNLPDADEVSGRVALTGRVSGAAAHPDATGSLEVVDGRVGHFRVGNARVEGSVHGDRIELAKVRTDAIGGTADARASILLAPGLPTTVTASARGATLEGLVSALGRPGSWAGGHLEVHASVTGTLAPIHLAGDARVELKGFQVLDRSVYRGPATEDDTILTLPPTHIDGSVVFSAAGVEVPRARIRLAHSEAITRGHFPFDLDHDLDVDVDLDHVDLAEIDRIADLPFRGQLDGKTHLGGVYDSPLIDGRAEVRGLVFDGLDAGRGLRRCPLRRPGPLPDPGPWPARAHRLQPRPVLGAPQALAGEDGHPGEQRRRPGRGRGRRAPGLPPPGEALPRRPGPPPRDGAPHRRQEDPDHHRRRHRHRRGPLRAALPAGAHPREAGAAPALRARRGGGEPRHRQPAAGPGLRGGRRAARPLA